MLWLKCCPRCGGDLYEGSDTYGDYISCAQCAHYLTEAEEVVLHYFCRRRPAADAMEGTVELAGVAASEY